MTHDPTRPPPNPYGTGPSTPHSIRVNDKLWEAFGRTAEAQGLTRPEVMVWLMERYVANDPIPPPHPDAVLVDVRARYERATAEAEEPELPLRAARQETHKVLTDVLAGVKRG